jgi:hypothetical protein
VTPLVALLLSCEEDYPALAAALEELFGPRELESPVSFFSSTDYYRPTMGPNLKRRLVTFARLGDPANLASWKLTANALERALAKRASPGGPVRPVNVDPGYLTAAKLVLASTKDFAHRIYLRDGVFAEITLSYRGGAWTPHAYTFPDFRSGRYFDFLTQARAAHLRKAKDGAAEASPAAAPNLPHKGAARPSGA